MFSVGETARRAVFPVIPPKGGILPNFDDNVGDPASRRGMTSD